MTCDGMLLKGPDGTLPKLPMLRPLIHLRTLALISVFVLLNPVENVQAEDCGNTGFGCPDGWTCAFNDAGKFAGCCAPGGSVCGDSDETRRCCNFPTPDCADSTLGLCARKLPNLPDGPCKEPGCIIGAETQTLGEVVPLTGTPLSLNYQSNLASRRHRLGLGGWSFSVLHSYDSQGQTLYLGNGDQRNTTARNGSSLPGSSSSDVFVPAEDSSELYVFNSAGRHLRTLDALTGSVRFQFTYDSADHLATITDAADNVTTIERDGSGNPSAIVAPFGQRTTLAVDGEGYLSRVTNPAAEARQFTYQTSFIKGLLTTHTDPRGHTYRYLFEPTGVLLRDESATGGATNLVRRDITNDHYSVTVTRATGAATTYEVQQLPTGETLRRVDRGGARTESIISPNGNRRQIHADGTIVNLVNGADPRFGTDVPIVTSRIITSPGGLVWTTMTGRTVSLADSSNPLSLTTQTDTVTTNGRTYTRSYDAISRTFKDTTPMGRQGVTTFDAKGRVLKIAENGIAPIELAYDVDGRPVSRIQGDRIFTFTYDHQGYLSMLTDPLGRHVGFKYDAAGRMKRQMLPDGRQIDYGYDGNGNMTSLTPPRRPSHVFTYTAVDQMEEYRPPLLTGGGSTRFNYDLDNKISRVMRPNGQLINFGYDDVGRLITQTTPVGISNYAYDATSGNLNRILTADGQKLDFTYDGPLLTKVASAGTISGEIGFEYNNDLRLSSLTVNGADSIRFAYDADGLLTQAGALLLTRDEQNGLVSGTALGIVNDTLSYNGFGELISYTARVNANPVLTTEFRRDKLGRITQKKETIGGVSDTYNYSYDLAGRITNVEGNGIVSASYTYDQNGNRLHISSSVGSFASYDAQDRLLRDKDSTYTYTANGELKSRANGASVTNYYYDVLGNLKQVTLPNGTNINYIIDGKNRRIGKEVNGTLKQAFLYQDQLKPMVEFDGNNNIVSRFIYGTKVNVPHYMIKGSITYRIITDQLGSPRLVINTIDGSVAQRMDYDEFGRVTVDTAPGFQPFGFAGGLYDPDTKLVRFGARDYDAQTGRWTAKDPILFKGGDTNLYGYVVSDPVNLNDPTGTGPIDFFGCLLRGEALSKCFDDEAERFRCRRIKDKAIEDCTRDVLENKCYPLSGNHDAFWDCVNGILRHAECI